MDGGHDAALDADRIVQHLGQRGQTVGGAGAVRDHPLIGQHLAVVDAIDHGAVDVFRGGRDQDLFCATLKVDRRFLAVIEFTGAFQNNVTAVPVQFLGVVGREHLHRAATDIHRVAVHFDVIAETAMDAVIAQEVGVGLNRAGRVDLDDLDVVAGSLSNVGQGAAANAAKAINADRDGHEDSPDAARIKAT